MSEKKTPKKDRKLYSINPNYEYIVRVDYPMSYRDGQTLQDVQTTVRPITVKFEPHSFKRPVMVSVPGTDPVKSQKNQTCGILFFDAEFDRLMKRSEQLFITEDHREKFWTQMINDNNCADNEMSKEREFGTWESVIAGRLRWSQVEGKRKTNVRNPIASIQQQEKLANAKPEPGAAA